MLSDLNGDRALVVDQPSIEYQVSRLSKQHRRIVPPLIMVPMTFPGPVYFICVAYHKEIRSQFSAYDCSPKGKNLKQFSQIHLLTRKAVVLIHYFLFYTQKYQNNSAYGAITQNIV